MCSVSVSPFIKNRKGDKPKAGFYFLWSWSSLLKCLFPACWVHTVLPVHRLHAKAEICSFKTKPIDNTHMHSRMLRICGSECLSNKETTLSSFIVPVYSRATKPVCPSGEFWWSKVVNRRNKIPFTVSKKVNLHNLKRILWVLNGKHKDFNATWLQLCHGEVLHR